MTRHDACIDHADADLLDGFTHLAMGIVGRRQEGSSLDAVENLGTEESTAFADVGERKTGYLGRIKPGRLAGARLVRRSPYARLHFRIEKR